VYLLEHKLEDNPQSFYEIDVNKSCAQLKGAMIINLAARMCDCEGVRQKVLRGDIFQEFAEHHR
jgi:hypothetical protein